MRRSPARGGVVALSAAPPTAIHGTESIDVQSGVVGAAPCQVLLAGSTRRQLTARQNAARQAQGVRSPGGGGVRQSERSSRRRQRPKPLPEQFPEQLPEQGRAGRQQHSPIWCTFKLIFPQAVPFFCAGN